MSEQSNHRDGQGADGADLSARPPADDPGHGFWHKAWQVFQVVQARLRFIALLVVLGLVLGSWGTLSNVWEKWTRPAAAQAAAASDVEWFCPMHPFIVRDDPREKCPICHMDLARRKKGAGQGESLSAGTVSRVQLTPYRQVLAGVQTSEVTYHPLAREITTIGTVEFDETKQAHISATQKGRIVKQYVNFTGQNVEKGEKLAVLDVRYSPELTVTLEDLLRARQNGNRDMERMARQRLRVWDLSDEQVEDFLRTGKVNTQLTISSPIAGHVIKKFQREGDFVDEGMALYDLADLHTVWIEAQVYETDQALLREGQKVVATTLSLPDEQFEGRVSLVYPHLDEATRTLTVRLEVPNPAHRLRPGMYATVKVRVPPAEIDAVARAAGDPARLRQGLVLAVPDSAVIDTGSLKVVYREAAPDTYEGVAVRLGPRLAEEGQPGAWYPVLAGLKAGDRVVVNGAFLVDAETRLNPAAGSVYYGGSGGGKAGGGDASVRPSTPEDEDSRDRKVRLNLAKLSAEDRRLAEQQKFCPVLATSRLGLMGPPVKVVLEGRPVFLCCSSCEDRAKANPQQTLARVQELKAKAPRPAAQAPEEAASEDPKIKENLAKLSPEDRALAVDQKFCAIQNDTLLGEMGVPVKVMLEGQPVFLCCKGCKKEAEADPAKTLAKAKELRAKGHK
jgi:multidrug efflux pump subunit AcrA (membrane-fusion protein)